MLEDLDLSIEPGQKVLLAGPSGSGKSTLLRAIAGLLLAADVGELSGEVRVADKHPQAEPGTVGLLLQDPGAAVVAATAGRDVAFGLENTAVPRAQMPDRVRAALAEAQFPYAASRRTDALSGGETQRLALAGALALQPRVLLLDEPTSMLDEEHAAAVRRAVLDGVQRSGATLVVVEHRLGPWVEHVDRCVVLDRDGRIVADGPAHQVLAAQARSLTGQGVWVPGAGAPAPVRVDPSLLEAAASRTAGAPVVEATDVSVRRRAPLSIHRRPVETLALDGVGCRLHAGSALVLRGPSGAGKSTLLAVLAGLQRPDAGTAELLSGPGGGTVPLWRMASPDLARRVAWVPQLPEHGLVRHTVRDEMLLTAHALGMPLDAAHDRAGALLETLGLSALGDANAHHLSGGEQRRLVVAAALVHGPDVVLLDEPTVGQDRNTWAAVLGVCDAALAAGVTVGAATHDSTAVTQLTAGGGSVLDLAHGRLGGERG